MRRARRLRILRVIAPSVRSRSRLCPVDGRARAELQAMMIRLADGDRAAMEPVFAVVWPVVRRFAARALGGSDAEDAAQEALVRVFARAVEFDRERDALAWILGITMWQVRTARKRRQRRREDRASIERIEARTPEDELAEREIGAAVDE